LSAIIIILYLTLLIFFGAGFHLQIVNRSIDGSNQSVLLKIIGKWHKPLFSLFIYHVFNKIKLRYMLIKALSWLIVTGVFLLFADVSHDIRVAGIAILAIIIAHTVLIFEDHRFEDTYLSFVRNLPYTRGRLFVNNMVVYGVILLPEAVWLFSRFTPVTAVELMSFAISTALLFHSILYWLGLDMEKYLQWVFSIFIMIFIVILYHLMWLLIGLNLLISFIVFFRNYYRYQPTL
jgi:hypothetical protein